MGFFDCCSFAKSVHMFSDALVKQKHRNINFLKVGQNHIFFPWKNSRVGKGNWTCHFGLHGGKIAIWTKTSSGEWNITTLIPSRTVHPSTRLWPSLLECSLDLSWQDLYKDTEGCRINTSWTQMQHLSNGQLEAAGSLKSWKTLCS